MAALAVLRSGTPTASGARWTAGPPGRLPLLECKRYVWPVNILLPVTPKFPLEEKQEAARTYQENTEMGPTLFIILGFVSANYS